MKSAIKALGECISSLERVNKKLRKRNERQIAKSHPKVPSVDMTPKTRTNAQITQAEMNPKRVSQALRKRLLFGNVLVEEIKESATANNTTVGKRTVRKVVGGKIAKKYQLVSTMSKETGISRNHLQKVKNKSLAKLRKRRLVGVQTQLKSVQAFLEHEDNSRMMPGKKDSKTCDDEKVQKRILCNYTYNLYHKYMAENQAVKMSQATFYNPRPKYLLLAKFTTRDTFVSKAPKHGTNMLRTLKAKGATTVVNPDKFIK